MHGFVRVFIDEYRVFDERLPRLVEMSQALRDGREMRQHFGIGREALRCLPEDVLRLLVPARQHQRAAIHAERLAAGCRVLGHRPERFERLPQIAWVAALFGRIEPHLAECGIHARILLEVFGGAAERHDRKVAIAGAQVRAADGNQALGLGRIEGVQRIELFDFVARLLLQPVQLRKLFAGGNEGGGDGARALERHARFGQLFAVLETEPEDVVRLVKVRIQRDRLLQRGYRAREPSPSPRDASASL